jgi:hypothetical protein
MQNQPEYLKKCHGKDRMFLRHCINVQVMRRNPHIEWFLFLDADMGIVNPNHLIGCLTILKIFEQLFLEEYLGKYIPK